MGSVKNGSGQAYHQGITPKRPEDGQFIARADGQLTEFASLFVDYYVKNGGQARAAFLQAGGAVSGVRAGVRALLGSAKLRESIRKRQIQQMVSLANKAAATVEELMTTDDGTVPAAVRFQAAKWCMETAGVGPQFAEARASSGIPEDKPLEEMSIRELEAFITAGGQAVKAQRDQDARTIDITADRTE
jgi:hypothetical protein